MKWHFSGWACPKPALDPASVPRSHLQVRTDSGLKDVHGAGSGTGWNPWGQTHPFLPTWPRIHHTKKEKKKKRKDKEFVWLDFEHAQFQPDIKTNLKGELFLPRNFQGFSYCWPVSRKLRFCCQLFCSRLSKSWGREKTQRLRGKGCMLQRWHLCYCLNTWQGQGCFPSTYRWGPFQAIVE